MRLSSETVRPLDSEPVQDTAWVFPEIAAGRIRLNTVHSRIQWQWLIDATCYRAFFSQFSLDQNWPAHAQRIILNEISRFIDQLFQILPSDEEPIGLKAVSSLEYSVGKFTPRNSAYIYSIAWGLHQEWVLSTLIPDKSYLSAHDQSRYASFPDSVEHEYAASHQARDLLNVLNPYLNNTWDIAAILRGTETLEQTVASIEEAEAHERFVNGAITAINLYGTIQASRHEVTMAKFRN